MDIIVRVGLKSKTTIVDVKTIHINSIVNVKNKNIIVGANKKKLQAVDAQKEIT